jgi:HlyD family secretion protein
LTPYFKDGVLFMGDEKTAPRLDLSGLKIDPNAKTVKKSGKPWMLIGILAMLLILAFAAYGLLSAQKMEVTVMTVQNPGGHQINSVLNASGYVTPRLRSTIAAKITGRVKEMLVEEGMKVKEGDVLARLDDSDAQASFHASEAERNASVSGLHELEINLDEAQKNLERIKTLKAEGIMDQQSLDKAQATADGLKARLEMTRDQVKAVEAKMKMAEIEIENCVIRAPFSGIAVSKDAQVGEVVSPVSSGGHTRTGISTIVDMTSLEIEVDVNESYISKVTIDQKVKATLDAYPDWIMDGKVRTIIPTADRQKATVKVRISFDQLDEKIIPDMGVKVAFLNGESEKKEASQVRAIVPKEVLRQARGKTVVYVVKTGKLEERVVTTGASGTSGIEILSGVMPGEQLVLSGPPTLRDGQAVHVQS